jgi:hypothetical protein
VVGEQVAGVRVAVDRAARQREHQVLELAVQVIAARLQEVTVAGGDGCGCGFGQPGVRGAQGVEAGQLARAVLGLVEGGEQAARSMRFGTGSPPVTECQNCSRYRG